VKGLLHLPKYNFFVCFVILKKSKINNILVGLGLGPNPNPKVM